MQAHPNTAIFMQFEHMKDNATHEVERLADFLCELWRISLSGLLFTLSPCMCMNIQCLFNTHHLCTLCYSVSIFKCFDLFAFATVSLNLPQQIIGIPHTPELIARVVENSSFDSMKEQSGAGDTLGHLRKGVYVCMCVFV